MDAQAVDTVDKKSDERAALSATIDFKMVTFSLAGKEYGIDIMNVDGIANAGRFTYVPNAAPFVRGVYNLRGDIISIIDLRTMFHLPAERKDDEALESLIILRIDEHVFGVIVDNIDKVVGVPSSNIQPPHPIFGDINVKYIKGIIENQGKLYIIINVEKLFAQKSDDEESETQSIAAPRIAAPAAAVSKAGRDFARGDSSDVNADFVREALFSYKHFAVSALNIDWFKSRYAEWVKERKATDIQLKEHTEADLFLEGFYSSYTNALWTKEYAESVIAAFPRFEANVIHVWNPGCGKGYETYSLAFALKTAYPEARLKIWANDSDLLSISMAPNMVFKPEAVPEWYMPAMTQGRNGLSFNQTIRDSIFFEFHDVLNNTPVPPVDVIMCRDMVSFLATQDQGKLLNDFREKSKYGAVLMLGDNERMPLEGWKKADNSALSVYKKET